MDSTAELTLESPLLKIPQELLRNNLKNQQKLLERDKTWLGSACKQLADVVAQNDVDIYLNTLVTRLTTLKRKLASLETEEATFLECSRARLRHMQQLSEEGRSAAIVNSGSEARVERLVVEFMLRQGLSETARAVSSESGIDHLLDIEIFLQSKRIIEALRSRKLQECIAWCNEHKTILRKAKSSLEFELRRQEFIELIKSGNHVEAIAYAQKNLSPHRDGRSKEVDQVCALLCHKEGTQIEPYKALYSSARWDFLADLFVSTHQELYSIPRTSPLEVALCAGLSALKTSTCCVCTTEEATGTKGPVTTCPVCSLELNELAREVPFAHAVRSHLVDVLTGEVMEGENEPIVLPNGRVYGTKSLRQWGQRHSVREGFVQDPCTGQEFSTTAMRKAYVL